MRWALKPNQMSLNAKISGTPNVKGCCHWQSFGDPAKIRKYQQQANKNTHTGAISSVANNPIRHKKETRYIDNHCDVEPSVHCLTPPHFLLVQEMPENGARWHPPCLPSGRNQPIRVGM